MGYRIMTGVYKGEKRYWIEEKDGFFGWRALRAVDWNGHDVGYMTYDTEQAAEKAIQKMRGSRGEFDTTPEIVKEIPR